MERERRKPNTDKRLAALAAELDGALKQLRLSKVKIGRILLEARPLVPHGEWARWVEDRGLTDRTALRYMELAERTKSVKLTDLSDPTYRSVGMLTDLSPAEAEVPAEPESPTDETPPVTLPSHPPGTTAVSSGPIQFPRVSIHGRTTGERFPVTFYFDSETEAERVKAYFQQPARRSEPDAEKLLAMIDGQEKRQAV